MKPIYAKTYAEHQQISLLLPWYVNKTLHGDDLKAVEEHLGVCLLCKRELMQLHKLAQAVAQDESLSNAEQAGFSRLKKRIDGKRVSSETSTKFLPNLIRNVEIYGIPKTSKARRLYQSLPSRSLLAMAAMLFITFTVVMPRHQQDGQLPVSEFKTLSSDKKLQAVNTLDIRVVFADEVDVSQMGELLKAFNAELSNAQPTAQGVFTVRLRGDAPESRLVSVIEQLRKDERVVFAEPAYAFVAGDTGTK